MISKYFLFHKVPSFTSLNFMCGVNTVNEKNDFVVKKQQKGFMKKAHILENRKYEGSFKVLERIYELLLSWFYYI